MLSGHAKSIRALSGGDVCAGLLDAGDRAGIALLARFGVEDRLLDGDRRAFDRGDARVERRRVGIDPELLAGHPSSVRGNAEVPPAATGTDGAAEDGAPRRQLADGGMSALRAGRVPGAPAYTGPETRRHCASHVRGACRASCCVSPTSPRHAAQVRDMNGP